MLWRKRIDEFQRLGSLRGPLRDLVDGWARAWDSQQAAEAAWDAAGRPETERGSTGQDRTHHLALAKVRADRHLDGLAAKLERAGYRRAPRATGVPDGARVLGRLMRGGKQILDRDGRVRQQSVLDSGEWVLSWNEVRYDGGHLLRWVGEDGVPAFCKPPPRPVNRKPKLDEYRLWAELRHVPLAAVEGWAQRPDRRSPLTIRDDIDLARFGLAS